MPGKPQWYLMDIEHMQMAATIYPHVQKALHAELDAVVGPDRLPSKRGHFVWSYWCSINA